MIKKWCLAGFGPAVCSLAVAWDPAPAFAGTCAIPDVIVNSIQSKLAIVVTKNNGGLFSPNRMWSAVVDRTGKVCSVISSDPDAWPNSRAIALAKANTANGLSNNKLAVSTANWYSAVQPGGSLYGLNNSNPFNPAFLTPATPDPALGLGRAKTFRPRETGDAKFNLACCHNCELESTWLARSAVSDLVAPMRTPHVWIAAMSGFTPRMFMTRVRL